MSGVPPACLTMSCRYCRNCRGGAVGSLQRHGGTGAARRADLFVGDNRHALSGVLDEKAVWELARENAAGHDGEGALERAGGGNYGLGGLRKRIP
jgi:hypothetical protein